jgi:RimJ/RimL family protein N-acetyltransferase
MSISIQHARAKYTGRTKIKKGFWPLFVVKECSLIKKLNRVGYSNIPWRVRMEELLIIKNIVRLEFYQPVDRPLFDKYYLPEEQKQFTAHPFEALAACENEPARHPVMILHNHVPAGFFVLHGWEGVKDYTDNKQAMLLRAYSVDLSFQGKGIAQESLRLLPDFVKKCFPLVNEIILAVNEKNTRAQHVYKKSGFVDHGLRAMGRKGPMFIYHLKIG